MQQPEMYKACPLNLTADVMLLGNYFFNCYLVRGSRASALIEMGVSAVVDAVIGQLEHLGVSPDYLVLAHPHADHITGLPGLLEKYPEARLVAGEGARAFAEHPKAMAGMVYEDRLVSQRLGQEGLAVGRASLESLTFPTDHLVVAGPVDIDLGGLSLRCFPVAGHSPGNLAVHVPERAALFVSDSLGFHYPGRGFCPLFFTGYRPYLETLDVLAALQPRLVGLAHQGAVAGPEVAKVFQAAKTAAVEVFEKVNHSDVADETLARSLFEKYYVEEFTLYSEQNILNCCRLLVRRVQEASGNSMP